MNSNKNKFLPDFTEIEQKGLYIPSLEHDSCGVGVVANIQGKISNEIIRQGLTVLTNLSHRGAAGSDPKTGDGAGMLVQTPHKFFKKITSKNNISLPEPGKYGVGMCFLPNNPELNSLCKKVIETSFKENAFKILGWKNVETNDKTVGITAKSLMPKIEQIFVTSLKKDLKNNLEKELYIVRKSAEKKIGNLKISKKLEDLNKYFYICSLSSKTIVYKGMLMAEQLGSFFTDLNDPDFMSAFSLVHSRFSTNTLGSWKFAHPYRFLAHNGEINTVRGNRNWMQSRENSLESLDFGENIKKIVPVCETDNPSDTASLDNVFELLKMTGRSIEHVAAMMMPAAWFGHEQMLEKYKSFYEYHGNIMEPWDGPAMVVFSDGESLGAVLDRNGLRPFRFLVTKNDVLVMSSETGVLPVDPSEVKYRSRLSPGKMFLVDFKEKRIIEPNEVINRLSSRQPYGEWLKINRSILSNITPIKSRYKFDKKSLLTRQMVFGYSQEDLQFLIKPMAITAHQPQGSMGNDTPLAVLSDKPQNLFAYFKQGFAQVSNPPLDAIREKLVTQRSVPLGRRANIFNETSEHCKTLRIDHPILTNDELETIISSTINGVKTVSISTNFKLSTGESSLYSAIEKIQQQAEEAIKNGCTVIILSDRKIDRNHSFIPSLLAVGSVHHYLIKKRIRAQADIIIESGEPREVHHFATLFGYGASAINPYLAYESIQGLRATSKFKNEIPSNKKSELNFREAIEEGIVKTMAKMGISTIQSYTGAQIFEALGLSKKLIEKYFTWTVSRIGGIGLEEIYKDLLLWHTDAYTKDNIPSNLKLDIGGLYLWRSNGERHMWKPETISLLQDSTKRNDKKTFDIFEKESDIEGSKHISIRNMLDLIYDNPIPLESVEPVIEIVKRFATGAISLGSISREAHETLAVATNRINARSNTGEGGEDPNRFYIDENGDSKSSAVKQVASGRFGVTTNYLVNAKDIQIKMAQGAKPGEGGEIPGRKISDYIAYIRKTTPGVELISPPPHHDIYSIEDLAQLIHDLKNVNTEARIHVKLVSVAGVGIIAAGVAKGKGDVVLISGDSGGTGASPLSSIRHAGLPWELGLAETHQVLVANGLRDRIIVQTDGQIKTSKDVAIAALLGAEEWGVATGALVAMGCIMLRKCHLNTCSVGVATQDPELRKLFKGTPESVINYFMFLAENLRIHMSKMGFKTVNEMIGRVDKLSQRKNIKHWKANTLDLSPLLLKPKILQNDHTFCCKDQDHQIEKALDNSIINKFKKAIDSQSSFSTTIKIKNTNRTVGSILSGYITKKFGETGLKDDLIKINFEGSAGQSFGAWLVKGITFKLFGDSNDYFGKGLSGGRLIITPDAKSTFIAEKNVIIGNVALYGATGGEAYIRGVGGERFCVRNSAAIAVIEGIGDHGCEYMTGGKVVILGKTGRNFAAGMSGGIAYIWDPDNNFKKNFNGELCDLLNVEKKSTESKELKKIIERHYFYTKSSVAKDIINSWDISITKFKKVLPREYAKVINAIPGDQENFLGKSKSISKINKKVKTNG